jgi:alkanesulfonate monooxygenase SsuD/methylene tetrahydromethanopterin reductase-like flavin-dependent oxidoreductase (luciferase family)
MRFGLIQEGDFPPGTSVPQRYDEMLKEAVRAEEVGFDTYCLSEQHFLKEACTVSAPEAFLPFVAAHTREMRLRVTSAVLLSFNHPIRIAERLTTLDVLSGGRAELGTARSNNLHTLEGFGVSPQETRDQWTESLEVILAALTRDPFEYHGRYWDIPPRTLTPAPVQKPHPPIHVSATSLETHRNAGRRGIGVMTGNSILGWDYAARCIDAYQEGAARVEPAEGSYVNRSVGFFVAVAHCAATEEQAHREAARVTASFIDLVIWLFSRLGPTSPDYQYLSQIQKIEERREDIGFLVESAPYFMIGTPDRLEERLRRLEAMGVDQVLLRIDGMGHETNMRSIDRFGAEVLPRFGIARGGNAAAADSGQSIAAEAR